MPGTYSEGGGGLRHEWDVERLWALAEALPVITIPIEQITGVDKVTWFGPNHPPTVRSVAMHAKRIQEWDLSYPPILTEDWRVFDGMHRIARMLLDGHETVRVKRFEVNPTPDRVIVSDDAAGASPLTIRRLAPEDSFEEMTALLHRAYAPLAAAGLKYWATHQTAADTRERCEAGECWVGVMDGALMATVTLVAPGQGRGCPLYAEPTVSKFGQLAVDPALKGRGFGNALMDTIERRAREMGAATLALDTAEGARGLIAMYEARGYRKVGTVDWRPDTNYLSVLLSLELAREDTASSGVTS